MATDPTPPVGLEALPAKKDARARAQEYADDFIAKMPLMSADFANHLGAWFHSMMQVGADELEAVLSAEPRQQEPNAFESLKLLKKDWDTYGADPLDPAIVDSAELFWRRVAVVPGSDGSVQLEWHTHGFDIDICFNPDGTVEAYCDQAKGEATEPRPPATHTRRNLGNPDTTCGLLLHRLGEGLLVSGMDATCPTCKAVWDATPTIEPRQQESMNLRIFEVAGVFYLRDGHTGGSGSTPEAAMRDYVRGRNTDTQPMWPVAEVPDWQAAALLEDRTRQAIRDRLRAGEAGPAIAEDYGVPTAFVDHLGQWQLISDDVSAQPSQSWQPIDTAPQDGREVWLHDCGAVFVGYWDEDAKAWIDHGKVDPPPTEWKPYKKPAPPSVIPPASQEPT